MRGSIFGKTPSDDSRTEAQQGHDDLTGALIKLLRQGKKVEAITLYRQSTGTGLKDAKDAVDALERQIPK